jgi:pimeloyl-ACP methyl ester carboxylesterase
VIRIDLLGHGRSAKPTDGGYEIPDQARRAAVAMDRLGVKHAIVVGHSSGGILAIALAEQRPDLVSALTLINTGPRMDAYIGQEPAIDPSQWPYLTDEQLREIIRTAFSRAGYEIPQQLVDDLRGMPYHALASTMQASRHYLERQALPDRLTALGKPLLVIFGEDDRRWRSSSAAEYRAVLGAKVQLLPGAGHSPMLEDPPRTAALLLAFAGSAHSDKGGTDATVG